MSTEAGLSLSRFAISGEQIGRLMQSPEVAIPVTIGVVVGAVSLAAAAAAAPVVVKAASVVGEAVADTASKLSANFAEWLASLTPEDEHDPAPILSMVAAE